MFTREQKINEAGKIIADSALEFLSKKHKVSVDCIIGQINCGNPLIVKQYTELCADGAKAAKGLMKQGRISF